MTDVMPLEPELRMRVLGVIAELPSVLDMKLADYFAGCKVSEQLFKLYRNDTIHDFMAGRKEALGVTCFDFATLHKVERQPMNHLPLLFALYMGIGPA